MVKLYTDYPIVELGDLPYVEAPIRECELVSFDGDKYVKVRIHGYSGLVTEMKWGYVYMGKGRYGEVPKLTLEQVEYLCSEEFKNNS